MSSSFDRYTERLNDGDLTLPSLQDIDRALEQPAEADEATLRFIRERPDLAKAMAELRRRNVGQQVDGR